MGKLLIINEILNCQILAILRAKNQLDDFVDTLARLLPISWQPSNLQFISKCGAKLPILLVVIIAF